ncbi:glycosyltransferase family 2 protein [Velocimicrobium porci]|uniref:Glycosyltransferase n=1 Tax=Velocimicrobium porci TaxID=2606634 RepID=A0A6L5Y063_9FIRM|nr:glycosyltransferase [Velocimicrobium porci]MSS64510.1 glycosyltransferase [Velocimicrobium porci]
MKLSVVVPCYDEAENIPLILKRFSEVIKRDDIEVILVDNGSKDNSPQVLKELLPQYPFARTVRVEVNQGYGYGIVQGLLACSGDFIGWTHADMQTDPADLIKALNIIEANNNNEHLFIKGDRKGRPLFDQFFTTGMSIFETIYMGERLYDVNAQPNVFSKKFFKTWENPPKDFALDLYALYMARKAKLHIERFDVIFPERVHGESHWNKGLASKWKFIKRTIEFSKKLKKEGIH